MERKTATTTQITPAQNALDSLERIARDLEVEAENALHWKGSLAWGWHAVGLLAYLRLQPQSASFDTWIQDYLHTGEPDLDVERDAHWEEKQRLSFLELLDLLSEIELPILKPGFYQGWQDRTSRCRELRREITQLMGGSIAAHQRDQLLLLLAAYHRLIRLPAGATLETDPIKTAFPAVLDLLELLVDPATPESERLLDILDQCRTVLAKRSSVN